MRLKLNFDFWIDCFSDMKIGCYVVGDLINDHAGIPFQC
jgi:hypothetical protein